MRLSAMNERGLGAPAALTFPTGRGHHRGGACLARLWMACRRIDAEALATCVAAACVWAAGASAWVLFFVR
ncbi:MAG: hypothetical protein AB7P02_07925 [Alphaproteobacteria bacterium]